MKLKIHAWLGAIALGSLAIRGFKHVASIPRSVLFPCVMVLCTFGGVFGVNNNLFDVGVMFALGWLGFLMMCFRVPAAPFLIAFILGPLLEDNFRQAMLMSNYSPTSLFRSPITWVFWSLTLIAIFAIVRAGIPATRITSDASKIDGAPILKSAD